LNWHIELDDTFAVTTRGNRVSIIIDPVERTVDDYHVHVGGGSSWPMPVYHRLRLMVRVPAGAIGGEVKRALESNAHLLDAIADAYRGSNEVGLWDDDADTSILADDVAHLLEGVRCYWDAEDWIDWECSQEREGPALAMARAVVDAGDWTKGMDEYLAEFRGEGAIATAEAAREARDLLERVADELESDLDSAREDDEHAEAEELRAKVRTLREAMEVSDGH